MNSDDILALFQNIGISTKTNKPTQSSINDSQESIQDQVIAITICDNNLGFLEMVIWASEIDPLNNRNPISPPTYPRPFSNNTIYTAAQFTYTVLL